MMAENQVKKYAFPTKDEVPPGVVDMITTGIHIRLRRRSVKPSMMFSLSDLVFSMPVEVYEGK